MNDFPKNLMEFEERFATEEACLEFARAKKWPNGFRCAKCGGSESWPVHSRRVEECRGCGHQESVTAGTLFHQTRKPLRVWFRAITLWVTSKRALSAKELSRQLGLLLSDNYTSPVATITLPHPERAPGAADGRESVGE